MNSDSASVIPQQWKSFFILQTPEENARDSDPTAKDYLEYIRPQPKSPMELFALMFTVEDSEEDPTP